MSADNTIKTIVTLGPSTRTEAVLRRIKDKGVNFVRVNMSHSTLNDLEYFVALAKKVDLPFILDTEGSQIRTGELGADSIRLGENEEVKIFARPKIGNSEEITIKPGQILAELQKGDLLYVDFDLAILRVTDTSTFDQGYITARAISAGTVCGNRAVAVHPASPRKFSLPPLSPKDFLSIEIGLREGIKYIAASFARSGDFVDKVRQATKGQMKIISKIECIDSLNNLQEIIYKSDYLLLDRGDLSKEVPVEKITFLQKYIIKEAGKQNKGVFVAHNLLGSMVVKRQPSLAEVNDTINTVLDGAYGLALASETAIGKYPLQSINMLQKLASEAKNIKDIKFKIKTSEYLNNLDVPSHLVPPHSGNLVDRTLKELPSKDYLDSLPKLMLDQERLMDLEQIAIGAFSPLEGFMNQKEIISVLNTMRLPNGVIWPIPIVLDVTEDIARNFKNATDVALTDEEGDIVGLLHISDVYRFNLEEFAKKLYGTLDAAHPGVKIVKNYSPWFLGGKIDLIKRRQAECKEYELTPRQTRKLFSERGWRSVVGFHTRNVIHRSHEYIQLRALELVSADGLFVHPVVGKKKPGDFNAKFIIAAYERMMEKFYPQDSVVLATFATYSRYVGPKEAVFTAICRQNFGCDYFIVGRDHTGVGDFYHPKASHKIFEEFSDLKIKPVYFDEVYYSQKAKGYIHKPDAPNHALDDKLQISGTQARKLFEKGKTPPEWFMRPEISQIIVEAIQRGEEVFVPEETRAGGLVLWFTGLSGSGKTTLAEKLKEDLRSRNKKIAVLDGDEIRQTQHRHLGFSREDIRENNRLVAKLAKERLGENDFVLVPIISPYRDDRATARQIVGKEKYLEIYVNCPLAVCMDRDSKGLYKKVRDGKIRDFIGLSDSNPYESPTDSALTIETHKLNIQESTEKILEFLRENKWL